MIWFAMLHCTIPYLTFTTEAPAASEAPVLAEEPVVVDAPSVEDVVEGEGAPANVPDVEPAVEEPVAAEQAEEDDGGYKAGSVCGYCKYCKVNTLPTKLALDL